MYPCHIQSSYSHVPRLLCVGGGKKGLYPLFVHVPSSLGNLDTTKIKVNFCLPAEGLHHRDILLMDTYGHFEVKNNVALRVTVCIASFQMIGELKIQKDCVSQVLQCLAGIYEHVNDFYGQRAKCFCSSLVIVHRRCGQ